MIVLTFTDLEKTVIDAICAAHQDALPGLSDFMASAKVLKRENTGHGFYTHFRAASRHRDFAWPQPIAGPHAKMVGLGDDAWMGFLLWCSADEPSALEGFQYGDAKGHTVDLRNFDLAQLSCSELRPDKTLS